MAEAPDLLDALRDALVAAGVLRDPDVAGDEAPAWKEPRAGTPEPSSSAPVTVGLFTAPGVPTSRHEQRQHRIDGVDVRIRTKISPSARALEKRIRDVLADRRDWDMAGLRVIESIEYRPFQLLGADEQGFDYVIGYLFQTYVNQPA